VSFKFAVAIKTQPKLFSRPIIPSLALVSVLLESESCAVSFIFLCTRDQHASADTGAGGCDGYGSVEWGRRTLSPS